MHLTHDPLAPVAEFRAPEAESCGAKSRDAWAAASSQLPEQASAKYPFILLTGRGSASQWHTQTRTGKSEVLRKLYPQQLYVEINPNDARSLSIRPNEMVTVESQRGRVTAQAFVTPSVPIGQVFVAMHESDANQLTDAVFDPYSKQPSYKACAVRVTRIGA